MKLINKIKKIRDLLSVTSTSLYASSACYYLIVSLIPSILLLLSLVSLFPFASKWEILLQDILPDHLYSVLTDIIQLIHNHNSMGLLSVSGVITIWSASKGIMSLGKGLNYMTMSDKKNTYLYDRIRAILILFPVILFVTGALFLLTIASRLLPRLLPGLIGLYQTRLESSILQVVYSFVILVILFTIVYRLVPSISFPLRYCMAGAAITAAVWQFLSFAFSVYVQHISSYQTLYGSLGVIVLGMIWLQIAVRVLLLGGRFVFLISNDMIHLEDL